MPGPTGATYLAEPGADGIKVERPVGGDDTRAPVSAVQAGLVGAGGQRVGWYGPGGRDYRPQALNRAPD